jgi:hypothetical protein
MKIGSRELEMGLKTRLDSRAIENRSFTIVDLEGRQLAEVTLVCATSTTLEVTTIHGLHIEKPSGWSSKPGQLVN